MTTTTTTTRQYNGRTNRYTTVRTTTGPRDTTIKIGRRSVTVTNDTIERIAGSIPGANDRAVDRAESLLRSKYHDEIRSIAEELVGKINDPDDDEITTAEDVDRWMHETIDGHHDVIYTYAAQKVLIYSDNNGAYEEEYGSEGMIEDGAIQWSRLAYAAMLADVREQLDAEGIDLAEPFRCPACDTCHDDKADAIGCCATDDDETDDQTDANDPAEEV